MDNDVVIKIDKVSKKFSRNLRRSLFLGTWDLIRDLIGTPPDSTKLRKSEFWAIKDVSFEIKKGEKVAFIGQNGSGKSTLLRLINGILPPDEGSISIKGSIGALIAVGVGFHPHMTGRENIYLNATILGMSPKEIEEKFEDIINFAGIGEFIDAPVSTYSSGMRVRLGFSIAVHKNPDILIIDEILAVGDLAFQLKCLKKLADYRDSGGTFIMVAHNLQLIRNICTKVIWLENGKIILAGDPEEVCNAYEDFQLKLSVTPTSEAEEHPTNKMIIVQDVLDFKSISLNNSTEKIVEVENPAFIDLKIEFIAKEDIVDPIITIGLLNAKGDVIIESYSTNQKLPDIKANQKGFLSFRTDKLKIRPDTYTLGFTIASKDHMNKIAWYERAFTLIVRSVTGISYNQGMIYAEATWEIGS